MKTAIIYFSQTGNTEKIARAIQQGIKSAAGQCDLMPLKEAEPNNLRDYDLIGIGAPTFGFKEPANVSIFLNKMKSFKGLSDKNSFIFSTSGGHPGNILPSMAEKLHRAGLKVIGSLDCDGAMYLPDRFVPWYTDGHPDEIDLKASSDFGSDMVKKTEKLLNGEQVPLPEFKWLKDGIYALMSQGFKVDMLYDKEKCKYPKCRLCIDNCPMDAIDLSLDPPVVFGKGCISCWFCQNICPAGAINYAIGFEAMHELHSQLFKQYNYPEWFKRAETELIENRGSLYRNLIGKVDLDNHEKVNYKICPRPWFNKR